MSNPAELWAALQRGVTRDVMLAMYEHANVSSAIPSSEVAGTGRHSLRETGPEDLGGSPRVTDCGPATAGDSLPTQCSKCGPSCICDIAWNE